MIIQIPWNWHLASGLIIYWLQSGLFFVIIQDNEKVVHI